MRWVQTESPQQQAWIASNGNVVIIHMVVIHVVVIHVVSLKSLSLMKGALFTVLLFTEGQDACGAQLQFKTCDVLMCRKTFSKYSWKKLDILFVLKKLQNQLWSWSNSIVVLLSSHVCLYLTDIKHHALYAYCINILLYMYNDNVQYLFGTILQLHSSTVHYTVQELLQKLSKHCIALSK